MRLLVLIASLALATTALAEEKPKPKTTVKQLDKSSPLLMNTTSPGDSTEATDAKENYDRSKTRAQDYNSSRSNTTSLRGEDKRELGTGLPTGKRGPADGGNKDLGKEARCSMGSLDCDDDGDGIADAPANHNTTRSNRTQPVHDDNDPVVRKKPGRN